VGVTFRKYLPSADRYLGSSVVDGAWPESIPLVLSQVVEYSDSSWGDCIPTTHALGKFKFTDGRTGRRFKVLLCWEKPEWSVSGAGTEVGTGMLEILHSAVQRSTLRIHSLNFTLL
jgi:hypothetical protein